ncbi:MAG TPA: TlpA disulfide reductase family protein [Thermoanaerobaculia bacterium]|nr:TlpA disulfide reductase family protein [Thermoanaerobaculia bacterium]
MSSKRLCAALLFVVFGLSACGGRETESSSSVSTTAPPETKRSTAASSVDWSSEVQLVKVTHPQWVEELEAMRGGIVVVDNWATWCAPCLERFPHMLEMAKRWTPQGVTFVSLSLDDRDDPDSIEQAREFLRQQDARIPNYLMDEIIPDAFDRLGLLGIPAVFIYDSKGTMVHRLTGDDPNRQYTEEDVEEAIRAMVGAGLKGRSPRSP